MRKISVIPFVFMVSLFCCRFVKSINDTNINEKSIEDSKGTETTTMDTIVTEIMKDAKTTRKTKKMPADVTESSISNSTIENSMDRADIKNTSRSIFLNENIEDYWMNLGSSIHDELMDVQAIVVKDEEIMWRCQTANLKARTRYLICSGSIISDHHVLTSASCLHEATHIRHNIKAPLAVVVAPTKTSSQIIQVQDYVIHPNHQEDPYESNYLDHNLAILKLACRINARNLKKVKMPEFPFTDICGTQNCMVALFRKFDKSSYEMLETIAENIPLSKRKRDQDAVLRSSKVSNVTEGSWIDKKRSNREIRKLIYPPRFGSSFAATGLDRVNRNLKKNSSDIDNTKKANTQSTIVSTTTTAITEKYTRKTEAMETIEKSIIDNNSVNSIMARASDDMRFCPQTGSPVMFGNVQTAVVSVPCDDRQPWRQWGYTDLFVNIDWIKGMVKNWKKMENPAGEDTDTERPALPTGYEAAPIRDYRSNAKSIEQSPNEDHRQSTMEKCRSDTGNCAPEADILGMRLNDKMTQINKASSTSEIKDNNLLERVKFFNLQNQEKSIQNQSQQYTYTDGQAYRHYIDKKPHVVPEVSKTTFPLSGEKFENQLPAVPIRSTENRAMNFHSVASPLDAANATLFNTNLRGFFKNPKKNLNYPKIVENSNIEDTTQNHLIVVKLRIEKSHYDPLKTSGQVKEAILKNMSVTIDGNRAKNSEIYVNGKSLKNSKIYVSGERTRNSHSYRKDRDFRYFSRAARVYQNDRMIDKSITWTKDRTVRVPSSTAYARGQERQSYIANNGTMETRSDNNGYPGQAMEFTNNVANLPIVRKQDLRVLLRKNRQRGKD